jgi:hypothetical protein
MEIPSSRRNDSRTPQRPVAARAAAKVLDGCLFRDSFDGGDACRWSSTAGAPACP